MRVAAALATFCLASAARAEALDLSEIYSLGQYVQCNEACSQSGQGGTYEERRSYFACTAACGAPSFRWEKNGVAPVDEKDLDLALLETMDAADVHEDFVCYRGEHDDIVVPGALCADDVCERMPTCTTECALPNDVDLDCTDNEPGGPRCWWPSTRRPPACPDVVCDAAPDRSPAECADADDDGVPAWLEFALDRSDAAAEAVCGLSNPCTFDEACVYDEDLGNGECAARACGGSCTAFHLELVAQDDRELLVWVHYDYSPVPARVLDLNIVYDRDGLVLQDARPLPALAELDKQLASTSLSDGTLRLSVYDTASAWPVPFGPIVELVFQRISDDPVSIAFDDDDIAQYGAIAPLQGNSATQSELGNDELWGAGLFIPERDDVDTTLRLWLDFEDPQSPIGYANIPSAEELCERLSVCANEPDSAEKAKLIARLAALQRGSTSPIDSILGVTGNAAYFDGSFDHLRLPVHFDEPLDAQQQSYSYSTWFYTDGNSGDEAKTSEQLLYTHNAFNERTVFGFRLRGVTDNAMELVLFDGDVLSKSPPPTEVVLSPSLPVREWHHLGFAFDAPSGAMDIYVDGARAAFYAFDQPPPAVQCPQFADGTDILLHKEGDVLGGKTPEFLYTSVRRQNLYKIERMDLHGLSSQQIIGDGEFSYRDADYSPILDRLVYSSNQSGDFEIWIANGDGTNRRRITNGFGDTARGIFAQRPKWAPDGSAIVFESNVFDVLAGDNSFRRIYHLYYIEYNRTTNEVAIPLESGAIVQQLDYAERVNDLTIEGFRLTSLELDRNHNGATWLRGRFTEAGQSFRGELILDTSGPRQNGHEVQRAKIPDNIYATILSDVPNLGAVGQELELIAAHRSVRVAVPDNIVTERAFYKRSFATYEPESQFTVTTTPVAGGLFGGFDVTVTHNPNGYDDQCWDRNRNGLQDTDEDRNRDTAWDITDCYPADVRNLYIQYDGIRLEPVLMDDDGNYIAPGDLLGPVSAGGTNKELQLKEFFPNGHYLLRVEVLSPTNATPLPPGEVAVLRFLRKLPNDGVPLSFGRLSRLANDEYMVKDLNTNAAPWELHLGTSLEQVDDATFSPNGDRLLLAGISQARPVLLLTGGLVTLTGSERISPQPMKIRGLSWVREERYYACNWFGGYLHLQSKLILHGFRGGLDDTKLYSGLRDPDAFRSEFERGMARLQAEDREEAESRLPSCNGSHLECPSFHLCIDSECVMVGCDPSDPYSCTQHGGRCTLRPTSAEQEHQGPSGDTGLFDFVCATDCDVDRQCFTQTCLNGPCRFCETESQVCIECREAVTQLGALQLAGIEGCPDRRSFACEAGACITECYSFDDNASQYLCDPTTEYCDKGRCVLLDWDWWDFAPASFGGLGEMRRVLPPNLFNGYTQAVDQSIPIEITAYGVADFLTAPEIVVEVRGGPMYGGDWARIGRASVYNKTRVEAQQKPYIFTSPATFTEMRLRLVTDPQTNVGRRATGLGIFDEQFCIAEQHRIADESGQPFDATPCYRKAQGSRYGIGYPVGIPLHEAIEACREHHRPGCPSISPDEHDFMDGGNPTVAILEAKVAHGSAMNAITSNRVCSYEGNLSPLANGVAKKVFYGDITTEQSNERQAYCAQNPTRCATPTGLLDFNPALRGYALLNCNVFDPNGPSASVVFQNIPIVQEWPARSGPIVFDDGDTCTVEIDAARVAPCYEWMGGDVSADPGTNLGIALNGSLEMSLFRTFGHNDGFTSVPLPTYPLRVRVLGYPGGGLTLANGTDLLNVTTVTADQTLTFTNPVKEGRRYEVAVKTQPSNGNVRCLVTPGQEKGAIAVGGSTVTVTCARVFTIGGAVAGLTGSSTVTIEKRYNVGGTDATPEQLTRGNGAFQFAGTVPQNANYEIRVARQPYGFNCTIQNSLGRIFSSDITNVAVNCVPVPFFDLGINVTGLAGSGLQVLERTTGSLVSPTTSGTWKFPTQLAEGTPYELLVTRQPTGQACVFTTPTARVMPRDNELRNFLVCKNVTTYAVRGRVIGLQGDGLQLRLNGAENLSLNSPTPLVGELPFAFTTRLRNGDAYRVEVTTQPVAPAQICEVALPPGFISAADTDVIIACRPPNDQSGYTIGGTVTGLAGAQQPGTGLRLALNGGTSTLLIANNGAFNFEQPVGSDTSYDVTVDRQPGAPPQACTVNNGKGTVSASNITNIQVVCAPGGTVEVRMTLPTSNGAAVRAQLFSGSALLAEAPADIKVSGGAANFNMLGVGSTSVAVLAPGSYTLVVAVNQNGSVDASSGKPTWDQFDLGQTRSVSVVASQKTSVAIGTGNLSIMNLATVAAIAAVPADAVLSCYWAPDGAGAMALPAGQRSPVIARAARACQDGQTCWVLNIATTDQNEVLPAGSYDVTCWVDANETRGIDSGDYVGTTLSVDLPGAAPLMVLTRRP